MTDSTMATVEVLTAEVRTLMVGSRQVTLSVYNQLDEVEYPDIEPFGRVRAKGSMPAVIQVVGRSPGGHLVRSSIPSEPWEIDGLGYVPENSDFLHARRIYVGWQSADAEQRADMRSVAAEWSDLPLIVLAGLR
jgi:hypothetical protein